MPVGKCQESRPDGGWHRGKMGCSVRFPHGNVLDSLPETSLSMQNLHTPMIQSWLKLEVDCSIKTLLGLLSLSVAH